MAWPEFVPVLQRLVSEDPDADVRARAEVALVAFDRHLAST